MNTKLLVEHGLSFERLLSFVRVADAGGIALAAPGDTSQQSQMSRQISDLEGFFGKALTERRGRAIVLTEGGEKLAALAREVFKGLDAFKSGETGLSRFRLGAGDSLLQWWILPRVHTVLTKSSNASLSLTSLSTTDVLSQLGDARLDIGIVRQSERPKGTVLHTELLGTIEYALFVSKALMAKSGTRKADDVLAAVPLALQRSEPDLNESLERHSLGETVLECETFPQACRAVRSGEYAALLPVLARDELPAKDFAELQLPGLKRLAARMVLACHPRLKRQQPKAQAFFDVLARELRLPEK